MIDLTQLFDTYNRQARLYPALLTLAPLIAAALSIWPKVGHGASASILVALAAGLGILFLLADIARSWGQRLEKSLLAQWGGWPTTIWLRHSSGILSSDTLARYHAFLASSVPGLTIPDAAQEASDPASADARYASAAQWLKERARKAAPLVDRENATYGFRRNLLGLKPIGVTICVLSPIIDFFHLRYETPGVSLLAMAKTADMPQIFAALVAIAMLIVWTLVISQSWVREAGDAYARALLATCDSQC